MATSGELKAQLDARQAERETLFTEYAALRNALIEVYDQGGKVVETASNKVAACKARLDALDTIIARAEAAYTEQITAERSGEYKDILARMTVLLAKREAAVAAQGAGEQVARSSEPAYNAGLASAQGYTHSLANMESFRMSEVEIMQTRDNANAAIDRMLSAASTRWKHIEALGAALRARIAVESELRMLERQAYDLADLMGIEFDDKQARYERN